MRAVCDTMTDDAKVASKLNQQSSPYCPYVPTRFVTVLWVRRITLNCVSGGSAGDTGHDTHQYAWLPTLCIAGANT